MSSVRILTVMLLGTTAACAWQAEAMAADLVLSEPAGTIVQPNTELPAVSGINGKWELDPGILTGSPGVRGAGSVSLPLGDRFGAQLDGNLIWNGAGLTFGGAVHAFTRDPSKYLLGVTAGFVKAPGAMLGAIGPEGELYLDQFSFEGWAGIAGLDYVDPALLDKVGAFAIGDLAYYATPDWRVAVGGSYVLGDLSLHLGTEYQIHGLGTPLSLTGDARLHSGGSATFTVGLKGYFGGSDSKSLIDRQREDDPPNRAVDLFTGAGSQLYAQAPGGAACSTSFTNGSLGDYSRNITSTCTPEEQEQFCFDNGYDFWSSNGGGECYEYVS